MHPYAFLATLALAAAACAGEVAITSRTTGIVVDAGETGQFNLVGPQLVFTKDGESKDGESKGGDRTCKPAFTPDAGGLAGTIAYPDAPGRPVLRYTISAKDHAVTFAHDGLTPVPARIHCEMEFLVGQFVGGLYVVGGKPQVRLPLEPFKNQFFRDGLFSIAGRDGIGVSLRTTGGTSAFTDSRNFKGDRFSWLYDLPVKAADRSFTITIAPFATAPPALDLKPAGPPAQGTWEPIPELSDEFAGDRLDATKWNDHDLGWEGRLPSWFSPRNVAVKDGRLQLSAKLEDPPQEVKKRGFHTYTVAAVTSRRRVLYGYFEAKAKVMDVRICNAFWLYYNDKRDHSQSEIDIFEICGGRNQYERTLFHTIHVFEGEKSGGKHWAKARQLRAPTRLADDYHVYGLDWSKDQISCYLDGFLFSRFPNTDWHIPLNIDFDNEVNAPWFGQPEKDGFPGTFNIDYVRVWRRTDGTSPSQLLDPAGR